MSLNKMDFNTLKWLYDMGFALHYLHPKSKRPKGFDWQKAPKKKWDELVKAYHSGDNVGVRTGEPSHLKDGSFLVVLDIDVKSNDIKDANEAYRIAENFLGQKIKKVPQVKSGRGGFSCHVYARVIEPKASFNLVQSEKRVKVKMPSVKPGKKEIETLSEKEINEGWRIRPAFEIDILASGKQAAIPPSIHPDTGKEYKWVRGPASVLDLPLISEAKFKNLKRIENPSTNVSFTEVKIDELKLSEKSKKLILDLDGLDKYGGDRSSALFAIIGECVSQKLTDSQIISLLSDPSNAISEVVLDRCGNNFERATRWLTPQILKMREGKSPEAAFKESLEENFDELFAGTDWEFKEDMTLIGKKVYDELGGWENELEKNQQGAVKQSLKNACLYLHRGLESDKWLGFNDFTGVIEYVAPPPWNKKLKKGGWPSDEDLVECRLYLAKRFKFEPNANLMNDALIACAMKNTFHPVKEYLEGLKWDGVERIDSWLNTYMKANGDKYTMAVGRKTLVAAVKRIYEPGCKFDHVLILEGGQGIGKSSALRTLAGEWFCDSLGDVTNKDVIGQIQGSWIVEMSELTSLNKADSNALKEFITKQFDKARLAYERKSKIFPRKCILVGTTNEDEYLKDVTGNRRFWPVEVGVTDKKKIDLEALFDDRDQLWAEAVCAYKTGQETLWLDNEEVNKIAKEVQKSKVTSDPWDEVVARWRDVRIKEKKLKKGANHIRIEAKSNDLLRDLFNKSVSTCTRLCQMKIGNSLKKAGFKRIRKHEGWVWVYDVTTFR